MFKKFLATLALVGMIATTPVFAKSVPPTGAGTAISGFDVTPDTTFNPYKESVKASFNLTAPTGLALAADLEAYVLSPGGQTVATLDTYDAAKFTPVTITPPTTFVPLSYTWTGKDSKTGAVLADGDYTLKIFAHNAPNPANLVGQVIDSQIVTLTIDTSAVPKVTKLKADPLSFSPANNEDTQITFKVDHDAYVAVVVKDMILKNGVMVPDKTIRTFDSYTANTWHLKSETNSIGWNGKDSQDEEVVAKGTYVVQVTASNDDGTFVASTNVTVGDNAPYTSPKGIIKNFKVDPSLKWDPTNGVLKIDYELTSPVKNLMIEAKKGNKVVKVLDDQFVDEHNYKESWDGTKDNGDYVEQGDWVITLRADGDKASKTITVSYDQPSFVSAFVTKDSFDPDAKEFTNLVFKVDTSAPITVDVFQGTKKIKTLLDYQTVKKNKWYAVKWDGTDKDDENVAYGKDWKFKISAENGTDSNIFAATTVSFNVEQDTVSDKKSNITNDSSTPVVYDDSSDSAITLSYSIDSAADVYVAVYNGQSTSGKAEIELFGKDKYISQTASDHTVQWNGKNDKNKKLADGIYTYKIISRANGSYKETEIGRFVVGNTAGYVSTDSSNSSTGDSVNTSVVVDSVGTGSTAPKPAPKPTPKPVPPVAVATCGNYYDTQFVQKADYEMCQAIEWATAQGIFKGYADGSFGPYNNISRMEVLKVVLQSFDKVNILPSDGTNLGFPDLDHSAWYMPYVRTAKFYGMMQGYPDGTAKPAGNINRAEFLKFILEASKSFTGYTIPKYTFSYFADVDMNNPGQKWYMNYAGVAYELQLFSVYNKDTYSYGQPVYLKPAQAVTRGEVALALYRMKNSGLLGTGGMMPTTY